MIPEKLADINLLPTYEKQSNGGIAIFIALIFLTIAALGYVTFDYFSSKSTLEKVKSEEAALKVEVDAINAQLIALQNEGQVDSLKDSVQFAENFTYPTTLVIKEISELLPTNGHLTNYNYQSLEVTITNELESLDKVAEYTRSLTSSKLFKDAKVDNITATNYMVGVENEQDVYTEIVPRYEAIHSLKIDLGNLVEEADDRE